MILVSYTKFLSYPEDHRFSYEVEELTVPLKFRSKMVIPTRFSISDNMENRFPFGPIWLSLAHMAAEHGAGFACPKANLKAIGCSNLRRGGSELGTLKILTYGSN